MSFAGIALALATAATPASAQSGRYTQFTTVTYEFIKAVRDRNGNKLNELLQSGRPELINAKSDDGETALNITIARSDSEWTAYLIHKGADPNLPGKNGDTPLITASRVGFPEAVRWLLDVRANVNARNRMGETPLIVAVNQRQIPVIRMLLNAGADPDLADSAAGYSARDYAKRDTRSRQILQLIEAKKPKAAPATR